MTTIKRYIVEDDREFSVSLEADLDILTEELATEINTFWSEDRYRLGAEDGDVQKAVIRLFGKTAINIMLEEGGAEFSANNDAAGRYWSEKVRREEGWGGEVGDKAARGKFGQCGIRIAAAEVYCASFDSVELREIGD